MYRYQSEQNSQFSSPPLLYNLPNLLSGLLHITASTLDFCALDHYGASYIQSPTERSAP